MTTTAIADCKAGTFTTPWGVRVYVYTDPKRVQDGNITRTSYGKTEKGEVYNPDFAIRGDHHK